MSQGQQHYLQLMEDWLRIKVHGMLLVSHEETRVLADIRRLAEKLEYRLLTWSVSAGLREVSSQGDRSVTKDVDTSMTDPDAILRHIAGVKQDSRSIFVLADFGEFIAGSVVTRRLYRELLVSSRVTRKHIIMLQPTGGVHPELGKLLKVIEVPLPTRDEHLSRLADVSASLLKRAGFQVDLTDAEKRALVNAGLGLTRDEYDLAVSRAALGNRLDASAISSVTDEKRQIVKASGLLEFCPVRETVADVGGLDLLKGWLGQRERAFTQQARDFGLPRPKGVLTVGVPGGGKSLTAQAAAAALRLPLLRLDMGALMGSHVGQSEHNVRDAIALAETVAPCVLWMDEIDKSMSGLGSSGSSDGGTTARVLSTFLTWMSEKTSDVFIFATANDVDKLPPELLRKGRFDEIFAVDLPSPAERKEIAQIHIRKSGRDPAAFDLQAIADAAENFTGAEIGQAVIDALYRAFDQNRDMLTDDIVAASRATMPLAQTMPDQIRRVREFARTRARPASSSQRSSLNNEAEPPSSPKSDFPDIDIFDGSLDD